MTLSTECIAATRQTLNDMHGASWHIIRGGNVLDRGFILEVRTLDGIFHHVFQLDGTLAGSNKVS